MSPRNKHAIVQVPQTPCIRLCSYVNIRVHLVHKNQVSLHENFRYCGEATTPWNDGLSDFLKHSFSGHRGFLVSSDADIRACSHLSVFLRAPVLLSFRL